MTTSVEDEILHDALLQEAQRAQLWPKDYMRIYEAAGCPRELLESRQRGRPSFRLPSRVSQTSSRFHVAAPADPLPVIQAPVVDLEAQLAQDRSVVTAAHEEEWREWWERVGRASDIVRAEQPTTPTRHHQPPLTMDNPQGSHTRFEQLVMLPSLARPVSVTLQRVKPPNCHRSPHYPTAPSEARLKALPLPDRVAPRTTACTTQDPSSEVSPSRLSDLDKWKRGMGL